MEKIFDREETADLRRSLDGDMTSKMIDILGPLTRSCALSAALQIEDYANSNDQVIKYYYLKGGNSISILANTPPTGDYDFQVVPTKATYEAWEKQSRIIHNPNLPYDIRNTNFIEMHRRLIEVLLNSAKVLESVDSSLIRRIENVVDIELLGQLIREGKKKFDFLIADSPSVARVAYELANGSGDDPKASYKDKMRIIREGMRALEWVERSRELSQKGAASLDANYSTNTMSLTTIGKRYLDYSESEVLLVLEGEQHKSGRIVLDTKDPGAVVDSPYSNPDFKLYVTPTVYVNCTISGFLLYRLALIYEYVLYENTEGEAQSIKIKSEVVDLSIPRLLTPESELSTQDKVSMVTEKDSFYIPGWRYHLFENLLLLGEIRLGISGSEHKKAKRETRVIQAMSYLSNPQIPYNPLGGNNLITDQDASAFMSVLFDRYVDDSRGRNLVDPAEIAAARHSPSFFYQFSVESFYLDGEKLAVSAMDDLTQYYLEVCTQKFLQLTSTVPNLTYNGFAALVPETVNSLIKHTIIEPIDRASELLSKCFSQLDKSKPKEQKYLVAGALSGLIYQLAMMGFEVNKEKLYYPLKRVDIEVNQDVYNALNSLTNLDYQNISQQDPNRYSVARLDADSGISIQVTIDEGINTKGVVWLFSFSQRAGDDFTHLENMPNEIIASGNGVSWYLPDLLKSRDCLQSYMQNISIIELRYPLMQAYTQITKVVTKDPAIANEILSGEYAKQVQIEQDRRLATSYLDYLNAYDKVYPAGQ